MSVSAVLEKVEIVPLFSKKMEFSYMDKGDFVFCDPETYEMVNVDPDIVGNAKNFLVENGRATVTTIEERVVMVEIPASVTLTVSDAPERDQREILPTTFKKTLPLKQAYPSELLSSLRLVKKIKVDTRTGKYMERA